MSPDTPIAFAGVPIDLVENRRSTDELTVFSKDKTAKAIVLNEGNILVGENGELTNLHPSALIGKNIYDPGPLFLGLDNDVPLFAFSLAVPEEAESLGDRVRFENLRKLANMLDSHSLALAGRAKSLFDWHRAHKFCAMCGEESNSKSGGVSRKCPNCSTDHFPRVNPVAIMLVINGDKCLLGRSAAWPEGAFSALAGFVSVGETIEEACQREVMEEVGLKVTKPVYKFCQPWPYPSQLMMGMFCYTDETDLTIDEKEIAEARWFSKETVKGVFDGLNADFFCPPAFTIAHQLMKEWIES